MKKIDSPAQTAQKTSTQTTHRLALPTMIAIAIGSFACHAGVLETASNPKIQKESRTLDARPSMVLVPDFATLAERVSPSVVNISIFESDKPKKESSESTDPDVDELLKKYSIPAPPKEESAGRETKQGIGTGFIISSDGYIVTNAHVVSKASRLDVSLTDKRKFKARVIGSDERTDVALIKLENVKDLPVVQIGKSDSLRVGDWVLAIGSPFGLETTVTSGIVSAKSRDTGNFIDLIQTDVAINPGNSGGPLINMKGEVVGINSQIYSKSGGFMGISFSIPIDTAMSIAEVIKTKGKIARGRLGLTMSGVDEDVTVKLGLNEDGVILVQSVQDGGSADKAGVKRGDIIEKMDGKVVSKPLDGQRIVANGKPGQSIPIQVWRDGKRLTLAAVLDDSETKDTVVKKKGKESKEKTVNSRKFSFEVKAKSSVTAKAGFVLPGEADKDRDTQTASATEELAGFVAISSISDGPARVAGLKLGDVILSIDGNAVKSLDDFEKKMEKLDAAAAKDTVFLVRRDAIISYVYLKK